MILQSVLRDYYNNETSLRSYLWSTEAELEVAKKIAPIEEDFLKSLSDEQHKKYRELESLMIEKSSLKDERDFLSGFRIGATLMLETLNVQFV